MRKGVGTALSVLGGFLVMLALLAQFWAPGQLMKTPLDVDNVTKLEGEAQLGASETFPVRAYSTTRVDSERSDGDVVVFANSTCLVKDEGGVDGCVSADDPSDRLISATIDEFATGRFDALAINDPKYVSASAGSKEGVINKFPFKAEKTTYPYWDGVAGEAVDAVYDRTVNVDGLELYVYKIVVDDAPADLGGGITGTYSSDKEIWVTPLTGSITNQVERQERVTDDGAPFLLLDLAFTDEQFAASVEESKEQVGQLNLLTKTVPLVGLIVGIPLLLIGLFLTSRSGRRAA